MHGWYKLLGFTWRLIVILFLFFFFSAFLTCLFHAPYPGSNQSRQRSALLSTDDVCVCDLSAKTRVKPGHRGQQIFC